MKALSLVDVSCDFCVVYNKPTAFLRKAYCLDFNGMT